MVFHHDVMRPSAVTSPRVTQSASQESEDFKMESTVYEIYFICKNMPYRYLRSTEKEVDEVIKMVTLHGGVVTKIIKW